MAGLVIGILTAKLAKSCEDYVQYRELRTPSSGCSLSRYFIHVKGAANSFWSGLLHSE